jgi:hypothetical protein
LQPDAPKLIASGQGPELMLDDENIHRKRRQRVFETTVSVLKDEQEEWAAANSFPAGSRDLFSGAWGVRFAAEVAIGYLAVKRLMTRRLLENAFVSPEHACKGGRMDLWIGDETGTPGLAIELKYLMGPREARTVRRQAVRLCSAPDGDVTSAGFILWGHSSDWGFDQLFADQLAGWTSWTLESKEEVPAQWREHKTLNVWLFGAERSGP